MMPTTTNEKPTWNDTWQMIRGLWTEWDPTPQTTKWLWERWMPLHQDKLMDAVKQHRMEAASEKSNRPVFNRINDLYIERTVQQQLVVHTRVEKEKIQPLSDNDFKAWDIWAAKVMATATAEEIKAAQESVGLLSITTQRVLAIAVDLYREKNLTKSRKIPPRPLAPR
jgi:hypothetical protein